MRPFSKTVVVVTRDAAHPYVFEAVIKVLVSDPPEKRAREIAEGLGYACALLHDEYGWSVAAITDALERLIDNVQDDYQEYPEEETFDGH